MFINSIINEEKKSVGEIPSYIIYPKNFEGKLPVVFYYHGWSSKKENHLNIGRLLACNGYLVIMPDAVNHGERGSVNYDDPMVAVQCFWPTVENNIKEFPTLLAFLKGNYNIDDTRIGVTGHSMGAITTSGVLSAYSSIIKTCVTMNGSGNWKDLSIEIMGSRYDPANQMINHELDKVDSISPCRNIDSYIDKPILILHGESDQVVPPASDKAYYRELKEKYRDKDCVKLITLERLNHFVTEAYINEMISWFNKYL